MVWPEINALVARRLAVLAIGARDAQQRTVVLVRHHQQRTIRRDDDIPDAAVGVLEHPFLCDDGVALISLHARQHLEFKGSDQKVALPFGKHLAAIDRDGAGRDRRIPIMQRLFQPFLGRAFADLGAGIIAAIGDDRPAIVLARLDQVNLIAAARAVLDGVEFAGGLVERDALRVAVALRPDFRERLSSRPERVIGRDAAVGIDMYDRARIVLPVLRAIAIAAIADADEEAAILGDRDARTIVDAARRLAAPS